MTVTRPATMPGGAREVGGDVVAAVVVGGRVVMGLGLVVGGRVVLVEVVEVGPILLSCMSSEFIGLAR
ncbi:MAG: hypothetical protein ACRDZT_05290 [Acidimicrobiales bacterium]